MKNREEELQEAHKEALAIARSIKKGKLEQAIEDTRDLMNRLLELHTPTDE